MLAPYLDQIKAHADAERAEQVAAYHKAERPYLGVAVPVLNDLTKAWRKELSVAERSGRPTSTRRASRPPNC